jgi:hypothetical protein
VGHIVLGTPAATDFQNAVTWSIGGGKRLTSRVFPLASAFGNSAVLSDYDAPAELGGRPRGSLDRPCEPHRDP